MFEKETNEKLHDVIWIAVNYIYLFVRKNFLLWLFSDFTKNLVVGIGKSKASFIIGIISY